MSNMKNRTVNTNLDEELSSLGITANTKTLQVLSEGSDGGTFFSGSLFQHKRVDEAVATQDVSALPAEEKKVAHGMMKKGYKFIITGGNSKPLYAKSMDQAVKVAGEIGKGAKVAQLEGVDVEDIDPLDSEFVTVELMDRLEGLDLDSIDEDDLAEVLEGLGEKELPEDEDLVERVKSFVGQLTELTRATAGKVGGKTKITKMKGAAAAEAKWKSRKRRRSPKFKRMQKANARTAQGRKTAKAAKKRAKKSRRRNRGEGTELALELRGLGLTESAKSYGEYTETIERIGRVMDLISEWIDQPSVDEVLSESYENLTDSLMESTEDFQEKVAPCLNVIKRCLEEIEEGN